MQKLLDVKFLSAVAILLIWFALVLLGKAPAEQFIYALESVLASLGIFHAATSYQRADVSQTSTVAQVANAVGTMAAAEVAKDVSAASAGETAQ
jgi:uncharacterized membrane protein